MEVCFTGVDNELGEKMLDTILGLLGPGFLRLRFLVLEPRTPNLGCPLILTVLNRDSSWGTRIAVKYC